MPDRLPSRLTGARIRAGRATALAGALVVAGAGCGGGGGSPGAVVTLPTTTTTARATPATTARTPPPTTAWTATAPRATPDTAAAALVTNWAAANKTLALTMASPQAVNTLFAVAYPTGAAISRGCSSAFPPIVCTYGPPGGAPSTDALFELYMSQSPGGWYVSSVVIRQ